MRVSRNVAATVVLACVLIAAACARKAAAVAIVEAGQMVTFMGDVTMVREGGVMRPQIWKEGNVVIFRVDGNLGTEPGKQGRAYRINKENKFDDAGSVDLSKDNQQLAALFGVESGAK